MRRVVIFTILVNFLVALGIETYGEVTSSNPSLPSVPFLVTGILLFLAQTLFSRAYLARAWYQGYSKAVENTRDAVANRNIELLENKASNPINPYQKLKFSKGEK